MGVRTIARIGGAAAAFGVAFLTWAAPAGASVTGPCHGQATINGKSYTPANDSASNAIVLPKTGTVTYHGDTGGTAITNHHGEVQVQLASGWVRIANWAGANNDRKTTADGTYDIGTGFKKVPLKPVGLYKVRATETGTGGSCSGSVMIKIDGNPLATVPGAAAAVGTVATGVGLGLAALGGKIL